MSVKHPVLGYESKTAAARALHAQGLRSAEIAKRLGVSTANASALICYAKKSPLRMVGIPTATLEKLVSHAERRGTNANELVRRIVNAVAEENMVDNVLDDLEATA